MSDRRARREYERMMLALAELDRADGTMHLSAPTRPRYGPEPYPRRAKVRPSLGPRDYTPAGSRQRRRGLPDRVRYGLIYAALGTAVLLLSTTNYWMPALGLDSVAPISAGTGGLDAGPELTDDEDERLLPAVPATTSGSYVFIEARADGTPVSYSPCSAIHYVVNLDGAPSDGLDLVHEAVETISAASGLVFVEDGTTDTAVGVTDAEFFDGTADPVLIGWATGDEYPELAGTVAGLGGSASIDTDSGAFYLTGEVALDEDVYTELAAEGDHAVSLAILVHELGHLVGLGHVEDPNEIMHATSIDVTTLGVGDRAGLALLGSGPCIED